MSGLGDKEKWFDRIRKKKRFVIMDLNTFSEKKSTQLSTLNVVTIITSMALVLIFGTYFLIAYTPLKTLIPGYTQTSNRAAIEDNSKALDKLEEEISAKERYAESVRTILKGDIPGDTSAYHIDTLEFKDEQLVVSKSIEDSIFRAQMEAEYLDGGNTVDFGDNGSNMGELFYFTPVIGQVSQSYTPEKGHFGVDIVAPEKSGIKATLDGTVIFASWTSDAGHVIQIQHAYNLISIYKHNSVILKKVGDKVDAGEPIGIIGNTGKYSSGSHLHFELWQNGKALNPQMYINF